MRKKENETPGGGDPQADLKLISWLLQYPDDRFFNRLSELDAVVSSMAPGRFKAGLRRFTAYLRSKDPLSIQTDYTAAFDLNPSTTLNLTCHLIKEGEKRAGVLARLQQRYLDAGYERTANELPDYLPLVLEFISACPGAVVYEPICDCLKGLGPLIERLRENAPAYAELLQLIETPTEIRSSAVSETTGSRTGSLPPDRHRA